MRLANVDWFSIIRYDTFSFYYTTNNQFEQIVRRLKRYTIRISFTHHKLSLERMHFEELSTLTHIVSIHCSEPIMTSSESDFEPLMALPNLENLPPEFPPQIIESFNNLTQLKLYIDSYEAKKIKLKKFTRLISLSYMLPEDSDPTDADPLEDVQNPQLLTSLTIQNGRDTWFGLNFARFSNLKQLKFLDFCRQSIKATPFPELPNLEALLLRIRRFVPLTSSTNLTTLEVRFHSTTQDQIATLALLTKLKTLRITFISPANVENFQFMTALTNLECFGLSIFQQQDPNECPIFPYINGCKLTTLEAYPFVNCNLLTHLTNLLELKVDGEVTNLHQLQRLSLLTALDVPVRPAEDVKLIEQMTGLKSLSAFQWPKVKFQVDKLRHLEKLRCIGILQKLYIEEKSLRNLPLKKLEVTMRIRDKFLKAISNITTLEALTLHEASLGDRKLPYLRNLSNLTNLQVHFRKKVSGVILTSLTSLQYLVISYDTSFDIDEQTLTLKLPRLWHCEVRQRKSVIEMLHE